MALASPHGSPGRVYCGTLEEFTQLFGNLLAFVYHCFDRMVIHGYLSGLSRPEHWTFLPGPKFSKERAQMNLSRFYALAQIEYSRNFIFKRHFPIHKIFERTCEIGLWRLTAHRISEIFGVRLNK